MTDYIDLGPCPTDEDCAQVGRPDYYARAEKETRVYCNQLRRLFPDRQFKACHCPHDFGTYLTVGCVYDHADHESLKAALLVENNTPAKWDDEARAELGLDHA